MDRDAIRISWLRSQFSSLVTQRLGPGRFLAYVPDLFRIDVAEPSLRADFQGAVLSKEIATVDRLQGLAATERESLKSLFNVIGDGFAESTLCLSRPRVGQPDDIIAGGLLTPGKAYEIIHRDDARHDHTSGDIVDFTVLRLNRINFSVQKLDFDDVHIHLHRR